MKGRKPNIRVVEGGGRCPGAPAWLSLNAKREWKRVAPGLTARGLLTPDTSGTVESFCVAQGLVREHSETLTRCGSIIDTDDGPMVHPANKLLIAAQREARLLAGELGITPHRFLAGQPKKDDEDLKDFDV